jgi:hypothetical protein
MDYLLVLLVIDVLLINVGDCLRINWQGFQRLLPSSAANGKSVPTTMVRKRTAA